MGEGQNAVYLAQQGYTVEGLDISQVAIDRSLALAHKHQVAISAKRTDLDMHLFELMAYDSIIMMDFRPTVTRYYNEIVRSLKHGGTLLVDGPLTDETNINQKDLQLNHCFKSNELLHQLKGLTILFYQETSHEEFPRVQCLAEKPAHKDAEKLDIFDMHTKDKKKEATSIHLQMAENLFKK